MGADPCALLRLPGDTLDHVLSYTLPEEECQTLEYLGVLCGVCRRFRAFAMIAAPARLYLHDFDDEYPALSRKSTSGDKRARVLRALLRHGWMRQNLEEFHVSSSSVLLKSGSICDTIRSLLRQLLSLPGGFPSLTWLDINLQSDYFWGYHGVDGTLLQCIPTAMPSLERLCLVACFPRGDDNQEELEMEITPNQWINFFRRLNRPLQSLSLGQGMMSDEHVKAFMPVVGRDLRRLELIYCFTYDYEVEEECRLGDDSAIAVANNCANLVSFSFVHSDITTFALRSVLASNPGIRALDLSCNESLGSDTAGVIAQYLPQLTELRNYWPSPEADWLDNTTLESLCDSLAGKNGGDMPLSLLGLQCNNNRIRQGVMHAIHMGLKVIEIDDEDLHEEVEDSGSAVGIRYPSYEFYVGGSQMNSHKYEW